MVKQIIPRLSLVRNDNCDDDEAPTISQLKQQALEQFKSIIAYAIDPRPESSPDEISYKTFEA